MTKEQIYREQMKALGVYHEIHEPEIKTLAKIERQITRAEKAWSATASPAGSAPSFLDPHFAIIQKLRSEALQHREALGITVKALAKLTGGAGSGEADQKDLITAKLDRIADRVAGYDASGFVVGINPEDIHIDDENRFENVVIPNKSEVRVWLDGADPRRDPFAGIPAADEAAAISDMLDRQDHEVQVAQDLYETMPAAKTGAKISHGMDADLKNAVAEDMG